MNNFVLLLVLCFAFYVVILAYFSINRRDVGGVTIADVDATSFSTRTEKEHLIGPQPVFSCSPVIRDERLLLRWVPSTDGQVLRTNIYVSDKSDVDSATLLSSVASAPGILQEYFDGVSFQKVYWLSVIYNEDTESSKTLVRQIENRDNEFHNIDIRYDLPKESAIIEFTTPGNKHLKNVSIYALAASEDTPRLVYKKASTPYANHVVEHKTSVARIYWLSWTDDLNKESPTVLGGAITDDMLA